MALTLHYTGDVTDDIVGKVLGPDRHRAYYEAVAAEFDFQKNQSTVTLRPFDTSRPVRRTEFGEYVVDNGVRS
jgi:hypothetical protein